MRQSTARAPNPLIQAAGLPPGCGCPACRGWDALDIGGRRWAGHKNAVASFKNVLGLDECRRLSEPRLGRIHQDDEGPKRNALPASHRRRDVTQRLDETVYVTPGYIDELLAALRKERARRSFAKAEKQVKKRAIKCQTVLCETAAHAVADAITEQSKKCGADLIVLGTHGHRGIAPLVMGSERAGVSAFANRGDIWDRLSLDGQPFASLCQLSNRPWLQWMVASKTQKLLSPVCARQFATRIWRRD